MAAPMMSRLFPLVSHVYRQNGMKEQYILGSSIGRHGKDSFRSHNAPLHTSVTCAAGRKWREQQGLPRAGTEYGLLTDTPDWSYADGRPAPPSQGALRRKEQQRQLAMRIDQLAQEVLMAKEGHRQSLKALEENELDRQRRQLKPKGVAASDYKENHFKMRKVRKPVEDAEDV